MLKRPTLVLLAVALVTALASPLAAQQNPTSIELNLPGDLPGGDTVARSVSEGSPSVFVTDQLVGSLMAGPEALRTIPERLDEVASRNQMPIERLIQMLEDPTSFLDHSGRLGYIEPEPKLDEPTTGLEGPLAALAPLDQTFQLHSKPGSNRTIYLDFNGHALTNTVWNAGYGLPNGFPAAPFDRDGVPGFSDSELTEIQYIWALMAEDYAPFDVNVTTQEPTIDQIRRSSLADQTYGTRLLITSTSSYSVCGGCGGVAFVGVFDFYPGAGHDYYQPAWCFAGSLPTAKYVAECGSHEVGHNLGLGHDGLDGISSYYTGHDPWAPIMGVGYSQPVSQWSKGEYLGADNFQDDIQVMASNGVAERPDDHTNNANTATLFGISRPGVISSPADFDAFKFIASGNGTVTFRATPAPEGPNLDILLRLYQVPAVGDPVLLQEANPTASRVSFTTASGLDAAITRAVTAGTTYLMQVSGIGLGSPSTGYSKYGSLGAYTVSVEGMTGVMPGAGFGVVDRTQGRWYLLDPLTWETTTFYYGNPADYPIMGDWDCDGIDTPGLYRQADGFVYLRNSNSQGNADIRFFFGNPGDVPIVGDFNDDGCDTVSIYRPSQQVFYIMNALGADEGGLGAAEYSFVFGNPGDKPFSGDFDNDGVTEIGLHRESTGLVYYRNTLSTGNADAQFIYGNPGDRIVTGRWATNGGGGPETVALFRPSQGVMYVRYANSAGAANLSHKYGNSNMWPISGVFGPIPGGGATPPP